MDTILFEKCSDRFDNPDNWEPIGHEALLKEVPNDMIDMMIWFKTTIKIGAAKYRRFVSTHIIDWAKPETKYIC